MLYGMAFEYNDYVFEVYRSRVSARPEYDSARRTVKWIEYTIHIEKALVEPAFDAPDTGSNMAVLRARLMRPGGILKYEQKGIGAFTINEGKVKDACWGPRPQSLEFLLVTDNAQAMMVSYSIIVCIPECPGNALYEFGLCEFNFTQSQSIDNAGYSTINTKGHIEIPMTRRSANNPSLPDHVDKYRDLIRPEVPLGFRRTQTFTTSEDKRRLDFDFRDEQMAVALPAGIAEAPIKFTISAPSGKKKGFYNWDAALSGSIVPVAGVGKVHAWRTILAILYDKLLSAGRRMTTHYSVLTHVRISDDLFGRGFDFEIRYTLFEVGGLGGVLKNSGMWRPLEGYTFDRWRTSLDGNAHHVRGEAQVYFRKEDDAIIDLCNRPKPPDISPESTVEVDESYAEAAEAPAGGGKLAGGKLTGASSTWNWPGAGGSDWWPSDGLGPVKADDPRSASDPPENESWIMYESFVEYDEPVGQFIRHRPLDGRVEPNPGIPQDSALRGARSATGGKSPASALTNVPDVLQQIGAPAGRVFLVGEAVRLGHLVPRPDLKEVGGRPARLNCVLQWVERVVGQIGGTELNYARWCLEYLLEQPPREAILPPLDLLMGISSQDVKP